jgi:hypothetical protein
LAVKRKLKKIKIKAGNSLFYCRKSERKILSIRKTIDFSFRKRLRHTIQIEIYIIYIKEKGAQYYKDNRVIAQ